MSISCSCELNDDPEWYWKPVEPPKPLNIPESCNCFSCGIKLNPEDVGQVLERWRYREDDEWEGGEYDPEGVDPDDLTDQVDLPNWHRCTYCAALSDIVTKHEACYSTTESIESQLIAHITDGEACKDGQDPAAVLLFDLFEQFVGDICTSADYIHDYYHDRNNSGLAAVAR